MLGGVVKLIYYRKIPLPTRKSSSRGTEIYTLVYGKVVSGIDSVLLKNIFKYHFGHTAGAAAQYFLTL